MKKRTLTTYGMEVKKRLLELGLSQKDFCRLNGISETRFSEILYGVLPGYKYYELIARELNIRIPSQKKQLNHEPD